MSETFEDRNLQDATFWGVNLRNSSFRDVDLSGLRTHHVVLRDVEFDGIVDRLVVNGVDVTEFVAEHDPWQPLRGKLEPSTADEIRDSWRTLRSAWDETEAMAAGFTDEELRRSVDGEWSYVQTLRHLMFAADKWIVGPILNAPWQELGLPNSGSADFPWPGIDASIDPDTTTVLRSRIAQNEMIGAAIAQLTDSDLEREVEILEAGRAPAVLCWGVLFEEEFEHRRYVHRDLAKISAAAR